MLDFALIGRASDILAKAWLVGHSHSGSNTFCLERWGIIVACFAVCGSVRAGVCVRTCLHASVVSVFTLVFVFIQSVRACVCTFAEDELIAKGLMYEDSAPFAAELPHVIVLARSGASATGIVEQWRPEGMASASAVIDLCCQSVGAFWQMGNR